MSMLTASSTPADTGTLRLDVVRRGAVSVARVMASRAPLALRPLPPSGPTVRIAIVQSAACLVQGDDVRLAVRVGPGASLEVVELSATLAHPVSDGGLRLQTDIHVAAGGRLVWCEQPLILAAGTDLQRELRLTLGGDARVLHGDTLVLGRDDEDPGRARSRLRVTRDGAAVLDETVILGPGTVGSSSAALGDARAITGLTLLGVPLDEVVLPADAFVLADGDVALRRLSPARRVDDVDIARLRAAWAHAVLQAPLQELP